MACEATHVPAVTIKTPILFLRHHLLLASTLLCLGIIMLGMVLTSPARKGRKRHE